MLHDPPEISVTSQLYKQKQFLYNKIRTRRLMGCVATKFSMKNTPNVNYQLNLLNP